MSDAQALVLGAILVPAVLLGIVGMVRGYHLHLKVWKGDPKEDAHHHDHRHDR